MRNRVSWHSRRSVALVAALTLAWPAAAQAPELAMLGQLTKGSWVLRDRTDGAQRRICLRDGRELIQLRHREGGCNRFVVEDGASQVVVQYTCPGNGYGRTTIRRESSTLVQVNSTGIVDGAPFAYNAEARHAGAC
ncbi:MAG: hypothetical protein B7Z08_07955 [Sphingomonadales bacterium 32-68-7]|nr:MAG: hypothetical protein B7Z33_09960 [Sphingomonadales bacterium 12-68-11]OYX08801.1 MAG: hypothetical protein B7Z08_07955 [Sphingomonadales bacterium 32-68-7]